MSMTEISLCKACWCMTHTIKDKCGKCGAEKLPRCKYKKVHHHWEDGKMIYTQCSRKATTRGYCWQHYWISKGMTWRRESV